MQHSKAGDPSATAQADTSWLDRLPIPPRQLSPSAEHIAIRLRSLVANARDRFRPILGHTIWSLAACDQLGETDAEILLHLTGTWIRAGRDCGLRPAYRARGLVLDAVDGELLPGSEIEIEVPDRRASYPLIPREAIAAALQVIPWLLDHGWLLPPTCSATPTTAQGGEPWISIPTPAQGHSTIRCPDPAHDDQHASAFTVWDGEQGGCRCMACGERYLLRQSRRGGVAAAPAGSFTLADQQIAGTDPCTANNTAQRATDRLPGAVYVTGKRTVGADGRSTLTRNRSSAQSRASADAWASAHLGGSRAWGEAVDASWRAVRLGMEPAQALPERFESIGLQRPTGWREVHGRTRTWWQPTRWQPAGTERVLIDLDDLDPLTWDRERELPAILAGARALADRDPRVAHVDLVLTSETGLHLRIYLSGYVADERAWYSDPAVRTWLESWGAWLRRRVGRGGVVDPARWSPGGYLRRPGWRLLDDRRPFLVRLIEEPES